MSKLTSILLYTFLLAIAIKPSMAQNSLRGLKIIPQPDLSRAQVLRPASWLNEINIIAVRDFSRKYKDATKVVWTKNGNLISVYFIQDNINRRSTYDAKGTWEYTISYYDELKLPRDVRHLIKGAYYDRTILLVTEVQQQDGNAYFVKMEDDRSFLTVEVSDGEMTEYEKLSKL